jgi:hypothetical protein
MFCSGGDAMTTASQGSLELQCWTVYVPGKNMTLFCRKVLSCNRHGANPTIVSYNGSIGKIYNAIYSLVHFENKNIFIYFEEALWPTTKRCSCKFRSRWIGSWLIDLSTRTRSKQSLTETHPSQILLQLHTYIGILRLVNKTTCQQ